MIMLFFENDYSEGCCPEVLEALVKTNLEPLTPYGSDIYTQRAKEKILSSCGCPEGDVFLLVGGTQTNKTVIDAVLKKYEGVVSADTGHIAQHEAGAIESAGHKVLTVPHVDGKLPAKDLEALLKTFHDDANHDHMVFPGMVYISHPTEFGTLYTAQELKALADVCKAYDLPLYLDSARLGYGLAAGAATLREIAQYCDVFYIGGTKVGALCGEAVVFTKGNAPRQFITTVKQNGALLAKGRLTGVQFDRLFTDGLYEKISENAIILAQKLKNALREKGYRFFIDSPTNQIFVILENGFMEQLGQQVRFSFWQRFDENHTVIRFATSWATREEDVDALIALL
jgi:threonine aldolase